MRECAGGPLFALKERMVQAERVEELGAERLGQGLARGSLQGYAQQQIALQLDYITSLLEGGEYLVGTRTFSPLFGFRPTRGGR